MKHIRATLALGNSRTETVAFPCADSKIKQMLAHRTGDDKYTVYVDELTEPSWMKAIEKTDVNIHELNYLARRMDAMDDNELAKLGAALSRFGGANLSQFINYTFNLNRITLVRDLSDLQKVGVMHYMDRHGGCSVEESNDPQRAVEARELLERKDGILTDYGLLFINDEVPFVTVYNGVNFPEYWYEGVDKTGVCLSYTAADGTIKYRDIFHPVTATARQKLIGATVSAYHDALQQQEQAQTQKAVQSESPNAVPRDAPIMQM